MVLAVAVIDPQKEPLLKELGAKDSKLIPEPERDRLYPLMQRELHAYATVHLHAPEMDALMEVESLNEIEAMKIGHLLNGLKEKPELVYVDSPDPLASNFAKRIQQYISFKPRIIAEHKADVNYPIVSAASILAKVERDAEIKKIQSQFQDFGDIGSGYSHDERTISFIESYLKRFNSLPTCARKKWGTNVRLVNARYQTKLF
jgi:ribonuclease HII